MDYPYDLGQYGRRVTTASAEAQLWFDRGLVWSWGFNHDEAQRCLAQAQAADPDCAMAWWGEAYAAGPNYNMPWALMDAPGRAEALARAHAAVTGAAARRGNASETEAALIDAMAARYPQAEPAELDTMRGWDRDFADAMRKVAARFPEDADVAAILADALLNLTPWAMWDLSTGAPAPQTREVRTLLERHLARPGGMRHPGLLHFYIHLMEMSPEPERALRAGDALRDLVPDAGHLVHMATHIDMLCGDYEKVLRWNRRAVEADLKYYRREGALNIYTGYRQHDYHFVIYGALFLGQIEPALEAVRGLRETTPEEMLAIESPPMADYFEAYLSMLPHVLVRFGRWEEILDLPYPEDRALHCSEVAMIDYARGVALSALGRVEEAEVQIARFRASVAAVPETRLLHNNSVRRILEVAEQMLLGEYRYRLGEYEPAFAHLREGVRLEDGLAYDEPWGWMQPVRHALGALLYEQGRTEEAEAVFREDLGLGGTLPRACVHPDNLWALKGLHDCLAARGAAPEARLIGQRLALAEARADRQVAAA
ncbi:hypothetical protein E0K89_001770, partial [Aquicoccus sp. SCR17]|nr:hypothetical protein [Carideicomes alvinocaridis]